MTKIEMLEALKHVSNAERLNIAKACLRMAREEWKSLSPEEKNQQLAISSQLAILDYLKDEELTAFTTLDGEDFYEDIDENFANLGSHA